MVLAESELGIQIDSGRLWKPTTELTPEDVNRIAEIAGFCADWKDKPYDIVKIQKVVEGKEIEVDEYIYKPPVYSGTISFNGGKDLLHTVFQENPDRKVQAVCIQHYEGGTVQMHNLRKAIVSFSDGTVLFAKKESTGDSSAITIVEITRDILAVRSLT